MTGRRLALLVVVLVVAATTARWWYHPRPARPLHRLTRRNFFVNRPHLGLWLVKTTTRLPLARRRAHLLNSG